MSKKSKKKVRNYFLDVLDSGCQRITLSSIYNKETLNIFSDASTLQVNNIMYGCFGAICVVEDEIIDYMYMVKEYTTVNECEISGILLGLRFAYKYMGNFKSINLFSDSLISVKGLTEYIYGWKYNNYCLYNSNHEVVANQALFIEAYDLFQRILLSNPNVRIFWQAAHMKTENANDLCMAADKFKKNNRYYGSIELNFIRYISQYNNFVDNATRQYLKRYEQPAYVTRPVSFFPTHPY